MELKDRTTEELEARFDELEAHDFRMANEFTYALGVGYGVHADPNAGLDPEDPWGDRFAINDELAGRVK